MRNLFKSLIAFALLASGCSKDVNQEPSTGSTNQGTLPILSTSTSIESVQTRVNITDNSTAGLVFKWNSGDLVSIYKIVDETNLYSMENIKVAEYKAAVSDETVTFSVEEATFTSTIDPTENVQYVAAYLIKNQTNLAGRQWNFPIPVYDKEDDKLKYLANASKLMSGKFTFNGDPLVFNHEMAYQQLKIVRPTAVDGYTEAELAGIYSNTEPLYIAMANNLSKVAGYRFLKISWSDFVDEGGDMVLDFHIPLSAGNYSELLLAFSSNSNGVTPSIIFSRVLRVSSEMTLEAGVRYKNTTPIDGSEYYKVQE